MGAVAQLCLVALSLSCVYQNIPLSTSNTTSALSKMQRELIIEYDNYRSRFSCNVPLCYENISFNSTDTDDYSCCASCSCDPLCERSGDCCPDKLIHFPGAGLYPVGGIFDCLSTSLKSYPNYGNIHRQFISKCDLRFQDSDIRYKCETSKSDELDIIVPVSHKSTKEVYKNVFCAMCNYNAEETLLFWKINVTCQGRGFIPTSMSNVVSQIKAINDCNMIFEPPIGYDPPMCNQLISTCNVTGKWDMYDPLVEAGCAAYRSEFVFYAYRYRNIFCYICNSKYGNYPKCGRAKITPGLPGTVSFTALLEFRPLERQAPKILAQNQITCSSGFIYDHYQKICREIKCPPMTEYHNGTCKILMHSVQGLCLEAYIRITPDEVIYGDGMDSEIFRQVYNILSKCNTTEFQVNLYFQPSEDDGRASREYFVTHVIFDDDMECAAIIANMDEKRINLSQLLETVTVTISVYDVLSELIDEQFDQEAISIGDILKPIGLQSKHLCMSKLSPLLITKFLVCPMINLNISEFSEVSHNDNLYFTDLDLYISPRNYMKKDSKEIAICVDDYIPFTKPYIILKENNRSTNTNSLATITLICVCSSVICLLISLTIYTLLPSLRAQPGINNIFLSVSLLFALLLFGFVAGQTDNNLICIIIGISIHFFWLSYIFWMNICCVHMLKIFGSIRMTHLNNASVKTTAKYFLYSFFSSIVCIVINVVWSMTLKNDNSIGYGVRSNICYIQSPTMVAYTMTLPTCLVVICNIGMYIFVIWKIGRSQFESSNIQHNRRNLFVYIKLSTITGVTWLSFIPVYLTDHIVFEFIYTFLVACQGVFIMLAFICNKRVYDLLKEKWFKSFETRFDKKYSNRSLSQDTSVSTTVKQTHDAV